MSIRAFVCGIATAGIASFTVSRCRTYLEPIQPSPPVALDASLPVPSTFSSSQVDTFSKYGFPRNSQQLVFHKNHVVCYDRQRRIPLWVMSFSTLLI